MTEEYKTELLRRMADLKMLINNNSGRTAESYQNLLFWAMQETIWALLLDHKPKE